MGFTPFGLAAGAKVKMTFLRAHYTTVACCELPEAGVAIALIEAFAGYPVAVDATNAALKINTHLLANGVIKRYPVITNRQGICHRISGFSRHLSEHATDINFIAQTLTSTACLYSVPVLPPVLLACTEGSQAVPALLPRSM